MIKVADDGGRVVEWLERIRRRRLPCSVCGTFDPVKDRLPERSWRHVPLWGIEVELRYRPWRVKCSCCEALNVEKIPWTEGKSPISKPLIVVLATWSRLLPWDTVAKLFGVSWTTVVTAVDSVVDHGLARRDPSKLRYIGIDEMSRKRRHVYHTNVYDLQTKTLALVQGRTFRDDPARVLRCHRPCSDGFDPKVSAATCGPTTSRSSR